MKKQKGFTLVELLVVIAIIGILAAILLPSLGGAKTRALRAKAQSTISQLSQAIKAYQMDWGVYVPDGKNGSSATAPWDYESKTLIAYLDGDKETTTSVNNAAGGNLKVQYYEFSHKEIEGTNNSNLVLIDPFGSVYQYHNFANHNASGKIYTKKFDTSNPMHPRYTAINFRGFQLYTEANYPEDPYGQKFDKDVKKNEDTFKWITNYSN